MEYLGAITPYNKSFEYAPTGPDALTRRSIQTLAAHEQDNEFQMSALIFSCIAFIIIGYLASLQAMFNAAKKNDPMFFDEIGEPHIILNNKPRHTPKILKALLSFRYRRSVDGNVKLWGDVAYSLFVAAIMGFGYLFYVS